MTKHRRVPLLIGHSPRIFLFLDSPWHTIWTDCLFCRCISVVLWEFKQLKYLVDLHFSPIASKGRGWAGGSPSCCTTQRKHGQADGQRPDKLLGTTSCQTAGPGVWSRAGVVSAMGPCGSRPGTGHRCRPCSGAGYPPRCFCVTGGCREDDFLHCHEVSSPVAKYDERSEADIRLEQSTSANSRMWASVRPLVGPAKECN